MKIAILDDYQDAVRQLDCFSLLAGHEVTAYTDTPDRETLVARLREQDAVVLIRERTRIDAELLRQLPKLRLISQTGKISNHLVLADCTKHGVAVAEGVGSPVAPAELCWALIMAASRHLVPYCSALKAGCWQDSGRLGLGRTLDGLMLGIWGYGRIGRRIAAYGKAFGMRVLVWGSAASREQARQDGCLVAASREAFFRDCDVLSLHLRLTDSTRHLIGPEDLAQMKEDALLVNTSRAELLQPGALLAALRAGRPGSAALDVFETEPATPETEALLRLDNVLCSPHIGYVERNSYELYFGRAFENVNAFFAGELRAIANPEVLSLPSARP